MRQFDMALVDEIRKRLNASYEEALVGLEEADGDMLRALAAIERRRAEQEAAERSGELIGRAIGLAKAGRLKGLRVFLGKRPLRDLPLPKGFGGALVGELASVLLSQLKVELIEGEAEESQEQSAAEDVE
jgi:hypothetical protein